MTKQLTLVVKRDCPTCTLLEPVYAALAASGIALDVWTQDDPAFPESLSGQLDEGLERSFRLGVEIVPTLIRREDGEEVVRPLSVNRSEWN